MDKDKREQLLSQIDTILTSVIELTDDLEDMGRQTQKLEHRLEALAETIKDEPIS